MGAQSANETYAVVGLPVPSSISTRLQRTIEFHTLVLTAFAGTRPEGCTTDHIISDQSEVDSHL
jgi:hypothetical protein